MSSHNDPNARNVLFDGTRLWLIDWETAYRNDPMVDVAIFADNLAAPTRAEAEERQRRGELNDITQDNLQLAGKMCLAAFLSEAA